MTNNININQIKDLNIDTTGLTPMPALIDPHVHFRTPGLEHKEDWKTGARAALAGGVTTVFDMPNHRPNCTTWERLQEKKKIIDSQLEEIGIPLRYHLYLGAEQGNFEEFEKCQKGAVGIKVFMGSSTGNLLISDDKQLEMVFQLAAKNGMIVSVHAENEHVILADKGMYKNELDPAIHSTIRSEEAAILATLTVIELAEKYGTKLCILHVSTKGEMELIADAKKRGVKVYAEVTPHHLFLDIDDYKNLGTRVVINPPLRTKKDREALWQGIRDGTVDFIGTDHAPHLLAEKQLPYGQVPSGVPGIEFLLPLMLTAVHDGLITLPQLQRLTRDNIINIFGLLDNQDFLLVDMEKSHRITQQDVISKCGWTPYEGKTLKGWPIHAVVQGKLITTGR